ncbi:hypothetical protein Cgig2_003840 [Carnegiea gigantea]|uniref:Uncharacterized protein n=1 Tax=Carnegiea gigantea TaxID=171969 RepID=A0A9Q1K6G1_9CARY|nr:hypothetical protein Cgig2_003840 [Carnegiea gigantea]
MDFLVTRGGPFAGPLDFIIVGGASGLEGFLLTRGADLLSEYHNYVLKNHECKKIHPPRREANFCPWENCIATPRVEAAQFYNQQRILMKGPFSFIWYLGKQVTAQVDNKWHPFVPLDPYRSMLYVRIVVLDDMAEMKLGIHFVDCMHHHGDYATHLQYLMTHFVTTAKAFIPSLIVHVSREGKEATYVDAPVVLESECPKLSVPPTFTRVGLTSIRLQNPASKPTDLTVRASKTDRNSIEYGHVPRLAILTQEETFQGTVHNVVYPYSPHVLEHYLKWMIEHDAEMRKENATKKGATENDSSRNEKKRAKDTAPQRTSPWS